MAAKRRRYSDDERASLLAMLEAEGYPDKPGALTKVSHYAKMPHATLVLWWQKKRNPPPSELQQVKKLELADLFEEAARVYLEHGTRDAVVEDTSGKDALMAAAIAVDKMRLLRGLPTEIVQLIPDVVKAIQDLGQSPADVFEGIIRRAKQLQDQHASD
jgi:hypothetical protein